jgi:ligand-binding sensor domain-containing protein
MRLLKAKWPLFTGLTLSILLGFAGVAIWKASRALHRASEEVAAAENLQFTVSRLNGVVPSGVEWINSPAVLSDAAFFEGRLYLCGPSGLMEYSPDGKLEARYRVGLELPAAPLVGMSIGRAADAPEPELYLATAGAGVLAFSEKSSRQILPEAKPLRQLTAVLPLPTGRVLLGTEKSGVLVYDGTHLTSFHPQLTKFHITALVGDDSNLWAGTLNDGVIHWHAGQADRFAEAEGLPDPRILSLAMDGDRIFVGTPMGVAEFRDGKFARVLASSFFASSLLVDGETLIVGTLDEGILEVPLAASAKAGPRPRGQEISGRIVHLLSARGNLFALTDSGFYSFNPRGGTWRPVIEREAALLADRNVSALEFDSSGRLWVGYFDRGLDVLSPYSERATHIEDEHVFCVNRIVHDSQHDITDVATANGLVVFDGGLRQREVLGHNEGLIADHVTDLALTADGMTLATPAGVTFLTPSGARSIYAFHGLVNNHVYTLGAEGTRLLVGTLGGLSVLDEGQVRMNYTTANSGLKANWITALARVGDEWFVGSYGGGIFRLAASGRCEKFPDATGAFVVNPNAMLATGERVYAGTLERGLYVYDRSLGRWSDVTAALPSPNVTALAVHNGYLYIGTDNGLIRIVEQNLTGQRLRP